ncbi:MAG: ArdC-like ssDNA-binding domain-containing protein [Flammeovirgaceae bacterium]
MTSQQQEYQNRREALKALSNALKPLVKTGVHATVNEAIIEHYKQEGGHTTFNTLKQWNEAGRRIKKGSKAFVVWGSPKKTKRDEEDDEYSFFPLCYLFSDQQLK